MMTQYHTEHQRIQHILDFRLPHTYKKVGLSIAALLMVVLIAYKYVGSDTLVVKDTLRTMMLFAMLVASLSKDRLEDEYNRTVRFHSFVVAFVCAASYTIVIPLIALGLDALITHLTGDGAVTFYELSAFEVVFTMLGIQLLCFETLKRFDCAE